MFTDANGVMYLLLSLALVASSEGFFLKWGSDSTSQPTSHKTWVQPLSPNMSPGYHYQYAYPSYESRKVYQLQAPQYAPEVPVQHNMGQHNMAQHSIAPIPISVPAGASLTPVSLQHVQLVPCMCPVAPEEAEKLQDQVGPGPYLAQTYSHPSYSVPQQLPTGDSKPANKQ